MRNKKLKQIIFKLGLVLSVTLQSLFIPLALAQQTSEPLVPYSGPEESIRTFLCAPTVGLTDPNALSNCVNRLYRFGIAAGALVLIFFLVVAGYSYITGGEQGKAKGKAIFQNSLVGILILLLSFVLLNFINPSLTIFRPIQPPIFTAADLPSCEEVGFTSNCVMGNGTTVSVMSGGCAMPIDANAVKQFNATVHYAWGEGDHHRTVRIPPNGPPPKGAVDLATGGKGGVPVFAPITGKVDKRRDLGDGTGGYITISTDESNRGCASAVGCATLAHIDPSVQEGQFVRAGDQVGQLTQYRGSLGPHLHLELKIGRQWVLGDGKQGTWDNMKSAISSCAARSGASGGAPAGMAEVKSVVPDLQYASANPSSFNFMKKVLYTGSSAKYGQACYLTTETAAKIDNANQELQKSKPGWKIKAWDCFRPIEVQREMYDWTIANGQKGLAAEPGKGKHPQGKAIDATLVDSSGKDVNMPTHFDYYEKDQKQDPRTSAYKSTSQEQRNNAELLNKIMTGTGLKRAGNEWWHFEEK